MYDVNACLYYDIQGYMIIIEYVILIVFLAWFIDGLLSTVNVRRKVKDTKQKKILLSEEIILNWSVFCPVSVLYTYSVSNSWYEF